MNLQLGANGIIICLGLISRIPRTTTNCTYHLVRTNQSYNLLTGNKLIKNQILLINVSRL